MNPKILIGSPIFDGMAYCFEKFINSLKAIDYDNSDILIVDNSDKPGFFNELKKAEGIIKIKFDKKFPSKKIKLIETRNKILEYARENNYDYILMMDSDVIAPPDILSKLLNHNKDIVSGLYYNYFGKGEDIKWLPVCWKLLTEEEFDELKYKGVIPSNLSIEDCPRNITKEEVNLGQIMEVFHAPGGCLLISKKVFLDINYPVLETPTGRMYGDDVAFIRKCREAKFKIWCDTSILCEHLIWGKFTKDKQGNLIHPLSQD